jgi:hypothetical protein
MVFSCASKTCMSNLYCTLDLITLFPYTYTPGTFFYNQKVVNKITLIYSFERNDCTYFLQQDCLLKFMNSLWALRVHIAKYGKNLLIAWKFSSVTWLDASLHILRLPEWADSNKVINCLRGGGFSWAGQIYMAWNPRFMQPVTWRVRSLAPQFDHTDVVNPVSSSPQFLSNCLFYLFYFLPVSRQILSVKPPRLTQCVNHLIAACLLHTKHV